jgi:uncharacterized protein (TIGR02145 family)
MKPTYNFLIIITLILLSNISFSQSVPSYVPTNGLVGWWGFNGNAQDGSGNGNHGTVNGATLTTDRFGNQNGAYDFDGSNDFINVADHPDLRLVNTNFTLSTWYKVHSFGLPNRMFISKTDGPGSTNKWILMKVAVVNGGPAASFHTNGILGNFHLMGASPENSDWHQLIVRNNGGVFELFEDAVLIATSSTIQMQSSNLDIRIGGDEINGGGHWHFGKLDDIGIWNRALTQQEITNLYNSQLPTQTSLCLPTITTSSPSSVGMDSVVIGGNITNDGGSSIVLRGVCYSTSPNPNMGNSRTEDGSGIGSFNTVLRGLNPSTTYYARSYAKNSNGVVVYGNEVSFTTSAPLPGVRCPGTPTVTDIDGNIYNTVQIGNQCWTQSNLKVSKYRNGDSIPTGLNNSQWNSTTSGAYAIYNNDPVNDGLYGKLYNHYAVTDSRGLCPTGWHVPSDGEWNVMVKYLDPNADTVCGGCWQSNIAGGALKSTAMQPTPGGWNPPNTGATNSSGFTALPGGFRNDDGDFTNMPNNGCWWSSSVSFGSHAWYRSLYETNSFIPRHPNTPTHGVSVRCLKD